PLEILRWKLIRTKFSAPSSTPRTFQMLRDLEADLSHSYHGLQGEASFKLAWHQL
ncbi:unnamed protein product, partial [Nesidiocoris tenuis]